MSAYYALAVLGIAFVLYFVRAPQHKSSTQLPGGLKSSAKKLSGTSKSTAPTTREVVEGDGGKNNGQENGKGGGVSAVNVEESSNKSSSKETAPPTTKHHKIKAKSKARHSLLNRPDISVHSQPSTFEAFAPSTIQPSSSSSPVDDDLANGMDMTWIDSDEEPLQPPRVLKITNLSKPGNDFTTVTHKKSGGTVVQPLTKTQRRNAKKRVEVNAATTERRQLQEQRSLQYRLQQMREQDDKVKRTMPKVVKMNVDKSPPSSPPPSKWHTNGRPNVNNVHDKQNVITDGAIKPSTTTERVSSSASTPTTIQSFAMSSDERPPSSYDEDEDWTVVKKQGSPSDGSRPPSIKKKQKDKRQTSKNDAAMGYTDPGNRFIWGM